MIGWFRKGRSHEHDLQVLLEALKSALGAHLTSAVLFGSLASGEFRESQSDVNLMLVLDQTGPDQLAALTGPLKSWLRHGHPAPLILSAAELPSVGRDHPIEFLDILDHHRVLQGADVLSALAVDPRYLRAQCEHDLSLLVLRLRQGIAFCDGDKARLRALLRESIPSALTLFRAALRLEEKIPKLSKMEAARRLMTRAGVEPAVLEQIEAYHFARQSDQPSLIASDYLAQVEKVLTYLRGKP